MWPWGKVSKPIPAKLHSKSGTEEVWIHQFVSHEGQIVVIYTGLDGGQFIRSTEFQNFDFDVKKAGL